MRGEMRLPLAMPAPTGDVMADTLELTRFIKRCAECGQKFSPDAMFCPFDGVKLAEVAWDPSADPLVGKLIDGRYEVLGVLGEGGMGTVYKVLHTALQRPFAMKVLRRDLAREADLAARFTQEARATASIKHPNIVAISDFGRLAEDVPYFVMELLVGQTLSSAIKTGGPMPAARGIRIILQIAAALGAAHRARVVHRDLKPENVFLAGAHAAHGASARGGPTDDVRIVDFGAAMILGASRLTKTGIVFGTPHYMSPEQASGQVVDHRADIYALGVIMYEMFTGKVPFEADTYMGVLTQHMFVQPVPPSEVSAASKHLGALEDVTLRALEKKPELRYATMEELAADIQRAVSFEGDGSVRVAPSRRLGAPLASSGSAADAASGAMSGLANELELPTLEEAGVRARFSSIEARRRRAQRGVLYGAIVVGVAIAGASAARVLRARPEPPTTANEATTALPSTSSALKAPHAELPAPAAPTATASAPGTAETPSAPHPPERGRGVRGAPRAAPVGNPSAKRPAPAPSGVSEFSDPWAK